MKSVCFTGHRNLSFDIELEKRLEKEIRNLVESGAENFYCGGAVGWDTYCAETVLKVKQSMPHIRLKLILPCNEEQQTLKWSEAEKKRFREIREEADNLEYTSRDYSKDCMKIRNQRLVDLADICICYYNEKKSRSGTGQTVRMAEKKGIKVVNMFENS